jgi:hypothetical protein
MRTETVEIYSDAPNAVMRHPGRKLPGVLVQGDSLAKLCASADTLIAAGWGVLSEEDFEKLSGLRDQLRGYLNQYKAVLAAHGIELPAPG